MNNMTKYHPELHLLSEYAAGSMPLAQAACVSAHLYYCDQCQRTASQLQDVGGVLLERLDPQPVGEAMLNSVLARLDETPPLAYSQAQPSLAGQTPAMLRRLMKGDFSDLSWKKITKSLSISHLKTGDLGFEFALYHIKAGARIPDHDHRGSEMTLVLQGGFSDANGSYNQGDFIYRQTNDTHAPTALQSEDCICLAVLDAPLKFSGWKYRWMNPFLRLQAG
jgi:putative transcriptional regulator